MKTANFPIVEFQNIVRLNPYWSSWTCFCEVVKDRKNLSARTIKKYFYKLVDKDDYAASEKCELLDYLQGLNKTEPATI